MLGVVIDLGQVNEGVVMVRNKQERADELDNVVEELKKLKSFPPSMAAKVYGRLNFAEAQCSGRWLAPILEPVKQRALMGATVKVVTKEISESLNLAARLLRTAPPRRLVALAKEIPCLVFTDGAYEAGVASCGAVIISPRIPVPIAFGFEVPEKILDEWHSFGNEQVIAQAEMMPVVMCKRHLGHLLEGARVLYFIDNEGVKEAFVTGCTKSKASRTMLIEAMIQDSRNDSLSWYTRVPSPSNVADAPSRLKWQELSETLECDVINVKCDYSEWGKIGG